MQIIFIIAIIMIGILLSYWQSIPLFLGFLPGMFVLVVIGFNNGCRPKELMQATVQGVHKISNIIIILALIGLLIPSWTACGTITELIRLGISYIDERFFLVSCFLITAATSYILGTSTGSLSAIGISLLGVGVILQVPSELAAGAVVSGAFVGDRTSPFSSANQLVRVTAGLSEKEHQTAIWPSTVIAIIVTCLFFLAFDISSGRGTVESGERVADYMVGALSLHKILLLPPLILILSIVLRIRTKIAFVMSILTSIVIGSYMNNIGLWGWLNILLLGKINFASSVGSKALIHMLPLICFIILIGAFNGILDDIGLIQPYLAKLLTEKGSLAIYTMRVTVLALILNMIACNQTMPIMLSAGSLRSLWMKKFSAAELSRVVSDTSLIFAGLVPWNMLALLCSGILGVSTLDYLPYAVFLWILPLSTNVLSFCYTKAAERQ